MRSKFLCAAMASLLFFTSCATTIDGQTPGQIAGKVGDKVGDAVDSADRKASQFKNNTLNNLEKKLGPDVIDPTTGMSRDDYREQLSPPTPALRNDKYNEPAIPNVSQLLIDPAPPTIGKDKLITLNVTEDIPLKEVLVELARRADIDIELDPNIRGGIIFRAKDKPFSEVIDRICELTGLRYSVENGVLKVERDFPYVENYQVDFLNLLRSNKGGVNITTQVLSGGGASGGSSGGASGDGLSSGSQSALKTEYEGDLWKSVEENIKNILNLYGTTSPGISEDSLTRSPSDDGLGEVLGERVRTAANAALPAPTAAGAAARPGAATGAAATPRPGAAVGTAARVPGAAGTNANTAAAVQADSGQGEIIPTGSSLLSVNKQAGVISVLANQRQHREIKKYLAQINRQQSAQVLIEAKVVEVTLDEQHRNGIDWSLAVKKLSGLPDFSLGTKFPATPLSSDAGTSDNFFTFTLPNQEVLGIKGLNLDGFIQFAESFGVTRTLSSPRINAINNQQAVLTFAQNFVYFVLDVQEQNSTSTTAGTGQNTLNINSTPRTVPLGVILTLQPSINLDTNEVTMNVRPTLSRMKGSAADPAVALIGARNNAPNISSLIPIVEVRELDSILKIKSGQVMVIGGLMEERVDNRDTGLPYLSKMPFTGNLFKTSSKNTEVVETVIFIKATIVPGYGVDPADKSLYRKFTNDRHPLTF